MYQNQTLPEVKTRHLAIGILAVIMCNAGILLFIVKKGYLHKNNQVSNMSIGVAKPKIIKSRNPTQNSEQDNMTEFSFTLPQH